MDNRPRCPPLQQTQDQEPRCCTIIPIPASSCCTYVPLDKSNEPLQQKSLDELEKEYEKLMASDSRSLLKKCLDRNMFNSLKSKVTSDGSTLLDVIRSGLENHDSGVGVYAPDPAAYDVFSPLFDAIITKYHGFGPRNEQPPLMWGNPSKMSELDREGRYISSTRVRCGRSIRGYPFNPKMTFELYQKLEKQVSEALSSLDGVHAGTYESLSTMTAERQKQLIDEHYLFKEGDRFLESAKACQFWPTGRGIFMNENKTFLVWVGEEDHIRIISMQPGGNIGEVYQRLVDGVSKIENLLPFVRHPRLGYITFCPTNLGTTIRASVLIKLPNFGDVEELEALADQFQLQVRGSAGEHTTSPDGIYDVSNKRRVGVTEFQAVQQMYSGLTQIIRVHQEMDVVS